MAHTPSLMSTLPPELLDRIKMMAETHTYSEIREWLNQRGVPANYFHVLRFLRGQGIYPATWAVPAADQRTRVQQYGAALMAHESDLFTIRNLGLRGAVWTMCSRKLKGAGLIESTRQYSPVLFRLLVSREELGAWLDARR